MRKNMQDTPVTLLCVNMRRDFFESITNLIAGRNPDIICLQEAQRPFVERLARELGFASQFSLRAYNCSLVNESGYIEEGTAILWKPPITLVESSVYAYQEEDRLAPGRASEAPNDVRRTMLVIAFSVGKEVFRIGTTHFTWTPDGSASDEQRGDMRRMLLGLEKYHDEHGLVFCGDFNAPRGGEIFKMMSDVYVDNLPPHITTTLDQKLHRAAPLFHAVDNIFSTKEYSVGNVEVIDGVSDHMALFAKVSKNVM